MTDNQQPDIPQDVVHPEAFVLNDEFIRSITDGLYEERYVEVSQKLHELHPADIAYLLDMLNAEQRSAIIDLIRDNFAPEILIDVDSSLREEVVSLLGVAESAEVLSQLDTEDAVEFIEDLSEDDQQDILDAVSDEYRIELEEGLAQPENSVGRLMSKRVVIVPEYWNVGNAVDFLRTSETLPDDFHLMFVGDPKHRPVGGVLLSRLIRSKRDVAIRDIMTDIRSVPAGMDQEEAAYIFRKYGMVSAPVVNHEGRLVGVVSLDDVVDIIEEEAGEDMMRMGGVSSDDKFSALGDTIRQRFPWLFVNLITAVIASLVIWLFSDTIEQIVALAVLMPIVASMGGNAGTQTLTVAVRALATKELTSVNARRVIGKEILVGSANGILFALVSAVTVYVWYDDLMLSTVFAAATVVTLSCAGLAGALIPVMLERFKVDPAIASGVFLTTVTDMVGFFVFLGLSALILL